MAQDQQPVSDEEIEELRNEMGEQQKEIRDFLEGEGIDVSAWENNRNRARANGGEWLSFLCSTEYRVCDHRTRPTPRTDVSPRVDQVPSASTPGWHRPHAALLLVSRWGWLGERWCPSRYPTGTRPNTA